MRPLLIYSLMSDPLELLTLGPNLPTVYSQDLL